MAYVEISNDDYEDAKQILGDAPLPTGRLRLWSPMGTDRPTLQSEWRSRDGLARIWCDVPRLTEIPG